MLRGSGKLRNRLIVLVSVALLPAIVALALFVSSRYQTERKQEREELSSISALIASRYDSWLSEVEGSLASLASVLTVTQSGATPDCEAARAYLTGSTNAFANVLLVAPGGNTLCVLAPASSELPPDLSKIPSFQAALTSGDFAISPFAQITVGGPRAMPLAYPWLEGATLRGVILAAMDLRGLEEVLVDAPMPRDESARVYDSAGTVVGISGYQSSLLGEDQSAHPLFKAATQAGGTNTFELDNDQGTRGLYASSSAALRGNDRTFTVVVDVPTSVAYSDARQVLTGSLLLLGVGLIGVLSIAVFSANRLVLRPVRELKRRMRGRGAGDMATLGRPIKGPTEFQELGAAFDEMVSELNDRAAQVETSRQRLETMINSMPAVSFLISPDLDHFVEVSHQVAFFLGVPPERVIEDPLVAINTLGDEGRDRWFEAARACLASGSTTSAELSFRSFDGSQGWMHFFFTPTHDAEGKLIGVQGLAYPITDLVEAREELAAMNVVLEERVQERTLELRIANEDLEKLNTQLAQANQELESFSYTVSHDLRSPLRAIAGFTQIIMASHAQNLDEEGKGLLARVEIAAIRMGTLIDDLLELARVGRSELRIKPIDMSGQVRAIIEDIQESDPDRKVSVVVEDNLTIYGDPELTNLVLRNLLENSWKFTRQAMDPTITVGRLPESSDVIQPVFFVRDNGVGFDMKYVERLFSPFQRLHSQQEFEGTGIGLAIVERIVSRHGGKVWATSEPGKATTLFFQLAHSAAQAAQAQEISV